MITSVLLPGWAMIYSRRRSKALSFSRLPKVPHPVTAAIAQTPGRYSQPVLHYCRRMPPLGASEAEACPKSVTCTLGTPWAGLTGAAPGAASNAHTADRSGPQPLRYSHRYNIILNYESQPPGVLTTYQIGGIVSVGRNDGRRSSDDNHSLYKYPEVGIR